MERDEKIILNILESHEPNVLKRLVAYVEQERSQALGWAYAEACVVMDANKDVRKMEVPVFIKRAYTDLDLVPIREEYL